MGTVLDIISYIEHLPAWFKFWGVAGFFICLGTKVPSTKKGAMIYLIAHGPILWVIFPFVSLGYYFDRKSKS